LSNKGGEESEVLPEEKNPLEGEKRRERDVAKKKGKKNQKKKGEKKGGMNALEERRGRVSPGGENGEVKPVNVFGGKNAPNALPGGGSIPQKKNPAPWTKKGNIRKEGRKGKTAIKKGGGFLSKRREGREKKNPVLRGKGGKNRQTAFGGRGAGEKERGKGRRPFSNGEKKERVEVLGE